MLSISVFATSSLAAASYTITATTAEHRSGILEQATVSRAAALLSSLGFVRLAGPDSEGLVPGQLISRAARAARTDLRMMHSRLEAVGIDPTSESFSFSEAVHRSRLRYDLRIDRRRTPADAPWDALSAAAEAWVSPVLCSSGVDQLLPSVEGTLTALPGAVAQRFHIDGLVAAFDRPWPEAWT